MAASAAAVLTVSQGIRPGCASWARSRWAR